MMATPNGKANGTTVIEGRVEARNAQGVMVGGTWYNYSKFAQITPPQPGSQVRLQVSGGRWIRGLEVLAEPQTEAPQETGTPTTDQLQIRLRALALAVALHRPPAGATEAPVFLTETTLEAATKFEAWLLRDA